MLRNGFGYCYDFVVLLAVSATIVAVGIGLSTVAVLQVWWESQPPLSLSGLSISFFLFQVVFPCEPCWLLEFLHQNS